MAAFMNWFCRNGQRAGSHRTGGLDRLVLALEMLEPRHLLAADGFGTIDILDAAWRPDIAVHEAPIALPAASHKGLSHDQESLSTGHSPELIHLERVAADLGEIVELKERGDSLWCDDQWYDLGPA